MLFFVTKKKKSTQTGFACNFLQPLMQMCRGPYIPFFKINAPICCCPLFFEEYLNPQDHPLIFLWTHKECISAEYLLNFFSNLYLLPWLRKQAPRWRGEGKGTYMPPTFLWNRIFPDTFSWKFVFVSFSKAFKTFLALALPKFQIYGVKITGRYICEPKNWICSFFYHSPKQNSPLSQRKLIISPDWRFLNIYCSPSRKGEG